ncbi:MAG: beta-ketoacyl-[acyl-carrier-protein] synthase family protein [Verrucomicrobiia bacterium]
MIALHLKELLKNEPIAITGIGVVCAVGDTPENLWNSVLNAEARGEWIEFNEKIKLPACVVCYAQIDTPSAPGLKHSKYDRCVKLAYHAAKAALMDAKVLNESGKIENALLSRVGVVVGTSRGMVEKLGELFTTNPRKIPPSFSPNTSIAGLSGALATIFGFKGMSLTVSANCASSAVAIVIAAKEVALGTVGSMLVGGAEAPIHPAILYPMLKAGILGNGNGPHNVCRPFDISRNGTIIGEGSAFFYIEKLEQALSRGARIYALIGGWGIATEPGSNAIASDPDGKSLSYVIQEALNMANISADEISFISAHGTGTKLNDLAESRAINIVFGEPTPPVFSIKAVTGHCLGASSAIESLVSIIALNKSLIPPTANCIQKDPSCKINIVVNKPQNIKNPYSALVISSGFWGYQSAIIFKRFKPDTGN